MEQLTELWAKIMPYVINTFTTTTLLAIITAILKSWINTKFEKNKITIDTTEIAKKSSDAILSKISNLQLKQSIQPLVESEMKKVCENIYATYNRDCKILQNRLDKIVNILEAQAHYFDNSIGITEEAKQSVKDAINEARIGTLPEFVEVKVNLDDKNDTETVIKENDEQEHTVAVISR